MMWATDQLPLHLGPMPTLCPPAPIVFTTPSKFSRVAASCMHITPQTKVRSISSMTMFIALRLCLCEFQVRTTNSFWLGAFWESRKRRSDRVLLPPVCHKVISRLWVSVSSAFTSASGASQASALHQPVRHCIERSSHVNVTTRRPAATRVVVFQQTNLYLSLLASVDPSRRHSCRLLLIATIVLFRRRSSRVFWIVIHMLYCSPARLIDAGPRLSSVRSMREVVAESQSSSACDPRQ